MRVMKKVIALLTDFGYSDYYTGVLKGVIKKINPDIDVLDISHGIPSFDLLPAAFVIDKNFRFFPRSTVFLVVVDPGVGSDRKILLITHAGYSFIAPDNGVLTPILNQPKKIVRTLKGDRFFLIPGKIREKQVSTFEARDKMAPVAAYLSSGVDPEELSIITSKFVLLKGYSPIPEVNGIKGGIVYSDKFGNLVSNISGNLLFTALNKSGLSRFKVMIHGNEINDFYQTYMDGSRKPFILIGSHGNIEIAVNKGSATQLLDISVGQPLKIRFY